MPLWFLSMVSGTPIDDLLHPAGSIGTNNISFFTVLHDISIIMSLTKLLLKLYDTRCDIYLWHLGWFIFLDGIDGLFLLDFLPSDGSSCFLIIWVTQLFLTRIPLPSRSVTIRKNSMQHHAHAHQVQTSCTDLVNQKLQIRSKKSKLYYTNMHQTRP